MSRFNGAPVKAECETERGEGAMQDKRKQHGFACGFSRIVCTWVRASNGG
jgi:hypothetical protein